MPNNYRIFFKKLNDSDLNAFSLPVNPENIKESTDSDNEEYNVLSIGPVMQPRKPKLRIASFSSYFPGQADSLTLDPEAYRSPGYYINFFKSAMQNKEIITYIPSRRYETGEAYALELGSGFDALVTSFAYEEKGGETGDFYYDLELTEYKNFSPLKMTLTRASGEQGENGNGASAATQAQGAQGTVIATTERQRETPAGQLYVGGSVSVNGPYYYSSYGDEPHGRASGGTYNISRIVNDDPDRPYPIHIVNSMGGAVGWVKRAACSVVGDSM